jgi:hypothetical protein
LGWRSFFCWRSCGSELVDNECDAACQQVAEGLAGIDFNKFYSEGPFEGVKDEPVQEEIRVPDGEVGSLPHGIEVWSVGAIGGDGVVVAINTLSSLDRQLLCRIVLQEYTQAEAATFIGMSVRTISYKFPQALDRMMEKLLASGLLVLLH